jgi:hypothetical protein
MTVAESGAEPDPRGASSMTTATYAPTTATIPARAAAPARRVAALARAARRWFRWEPRR